MKIDLEPQLRREQRAIQAMHQRPWWRVGILLRRPWRSRVTLAEAGLWAWLTVVHDCSDPMVACSCSGGFRFPSDLGPFREIPRILGKGGGSDCDNLASWRVAELKFATHQDSRDRDQERRDYVVSTALRLLDQAGKPVLEWPLALLNWPREKTPYALQWKGKYYRIGAIAPRGIIEGATHSYANEIVADEITEENPLRDYEREEPPFQLQVQS